MADPYVGQIIAVGFDFAPQGWLSCNGSLVAIDEYQLLYSLIGTTYGGDGQTTFGLPNLAGRLALSAGQGSGLQNYVQGQMAGTEQVTLNDTQLGAHSHTLMASSKTGTTNTPGAGTVLAATAAGSIEIYGASAPGVAMATGAIAAAGGSQPHENRQPFVTVNYIIAYAGDFPSQS